MNHGRRLGAFRAAEILVLRGGHLEMEIDWGSNEPEMRFQKLSISCGEQPHSRLGPL